VKPGALGEHPARENPLLLARELNLVHLDEGGGVWRFGGRARIADPRGDFQRAKLDRLIDGDLKMRDPARHLVESGEHGNWVLDGRGVRNPTRQSDKATRQNNRGQIASSKVHSISQNTLPSRHAAHLVVVSAGASSGALL
jgi:hypothetical protein